MKVSYTRRPAILKAYICVFICFSTKAVHLEAISDITTDAFLASLRIFIARRGKAQSISSDNGTNFVRAKRQLKNSWESPHHLALQDPALLC